MRLTAAITLAPLVLTGCCEESPRQHLPIVVHEILNSSAPIELQQVDASSGIWSADVSVLEGDERDELVSELFAAVSARRFDDPEMVAMTAPVYRMTLRRGINTLELVLHRPPANRLEYTLEPGTLAGMVNVDGGALRALDRLNQ